MQQRRDTTQNNSTVCAKFSRRLRHGIETALVYGLLYGLAPIAYLPLSWQWWIGRKLGGGLYHLLPRHRHIAEVNLRLSGLDDCDSRALFAELGCAVTDCLCTWFRSPQWLCKHADFSGVKHWHDVRQHGSVILLTAHFGSMEVLGALLGAQAPLHITYAPPHSAPFRDFQARRRQRHIKGLVSSTALRQMLRLLADGQTLWLAPDQALGGGQMGIDSHFFGQPVRSVNSVASLAKRSGASVLSAYALRDHKRARWCVHISPALEQFPSDNAPADVERINRLFEHMIRQAPAQYFWVHKRFKPIHPDTPNPYEQA